MIQSMDKQKHVKELANIMAYRPCSGDDCAPCERMGRYCRDYLQAEKAYDAGYRRLPVIPGSTVYTISRGKIKEWTVYYVGMNTLGHIMFNFHSKDLQNSRAACDADIGEIVFLTEEDAINELKERQAYDGT